jgi:hypothetical protein
MFKGGVWFVTEHVLLAGGDEAVNILQIRASTNISTSPNAASLQNTQLRFNLAIFGLRHGF